MNTLSMHSKNMREFRRLRAVELFEAGWRVSRIAEALGVTRGAVSQWLKTWREKGLDALLYRKVAKKPCKLSQDQLNELTTMLAQGPGAFGYVGEVWTRARVGELIERMFGVTYHVCYIGRI